MKKLLVLILVLAAHNVIHAELVDGIPASDLIAWFDASDIDVPTYVDPCNVMTTWPNKVVGGANDLVTTVDTVYYEANSIFNNLPCVDLLTTTAEMRSEGLVDMLDGKRFTIFTVVDTRYVGFTNGGGGSRLYGRGHTFVVGDPAVTATPPIQMNVPAVRMYKLDADWDKVTQTYSNGYIEMKLNNDPVNSATASTAAQGSVITFGNGYLEIPYGTNYGKFAEIIIYDRALTADEENAVGYYLSEKYDITTQYTSPTIYTLDISANYAFIDSITPAADTYEFLAGEEVDLLALPYNSCPDIYEFSNWTGNVAAPASFETTIVMDQNQTVVANYALSASQCVTLTIETSPAGLATTTPAAGDYEVVTGEVISIEALADHVACPAVYEFASWDGTGIDEPTSASTTVTISGNQTVTAIYNDVKACGDICHPYPDYDANQDCIVNLLDFSSFALEWMICTAPACD